MINNFHKSVRQWSTIQIFCRSLGYFWVSAKFPRYFLDFTKFPGYLRDFTKFPGCFQDCGVGVRDFIPKPGFLYLFRSWNTFSNWKKKKSRMGNVQNFTLTTMGVFPDQEWKIPRKSWNSISIFYSVMVTTSPTASPFSLVTTFNVKVIAYSFCWRERKRKYDFCSKAACSNCK